MDSGRDYCATWGGMRLLGVSRCTDPTSSSYSTGTGVS